MSNERINRTDKYNRIIASTSNNDKLTSKDKRDIVGGVAASMRSEMFGGADLSDLLNLKKNILERDKDITQAKSSFYSSKNFQTCKALKQLCLKQESDLKIYWGMCKEKIRLDNFAVDLLINQCNNYEKSLKSARDAEEKKFRDCSERVVNYDSKLAKYKTFANCCNLSVYEYKEAISLAEKLKAEIEFLKQNNRFVPKITWFAPDVLIRRMHEQLEKLNGMQEELLEDMKKKDELLSTMVNRDYKKMTIDDCQQIIRLCREQKNKIDFCNSKGFRLPWLNNFNVDRLIEKFESISQGKKNWEKEKKEKQERERLERQRIEKEKLELEQKARAEKEERDRRVRERMEQMRLEREKIERENQEKARIEREKLDKARQEREALERERRERERIENEKRLQRLKEKNEKELDTIYSKMYEWLPAEKTVEEEWREKTSAERLILMKKFFVLNKDVLKLANRLIEMHKECKIDPTSRTLRIMKDYMHSAEYFCFSNQHEYSYRGYGELKPADTRSIQKAIIDFKEEYEKIKSIREILRRIEWGY